MKEYKRSIVNEVKKARDTVYNEIKQLEYSVAKVNQVTDTAVSKNK